MPKKKFYSVKWYKSRQNLSDRDKFIKNLNKISLEEALPFLKELVVYILNQKLSKWSFSNPISKIFKLLEQKAFANDSDFEKIVSFYNDMLSSEFSSENIYYLKTRFLLLSQSITYKK